MNYAYFMYTSLCDWTNTCRLNWTDFLSFLSVQLNKEKTNFFFPDFPYNWLHGTCRLCELTGQYTEPSYSMGWLVTPRTDIIRELTRTPNTSEEGMQRCIIYWNRKQYYSRSWGADLQLHTGYHCRDSRRRLQDSRIHILRILCQQFSARLGW
jgi:hypothetical protein